MTFNLKEFIVTNIVNGIKNGTWTKEYANIMAVNYMSKGLIGIEEVAMIDAQITAWENEQKVQEEVVEEETTETDNEANDEGKTTETDENIETTEPVEPAETE